MHEHFELRPSKGQWLAGFAGIIPIGLLCWMLVDLRPWTTNGAMGMVLTVILIALMIAFFILSICIAIGSRRSKVVVDSTGLTIHGITRVTHIPIEQVERIRYGLPTPGHYSGHHLRESNSGFVVHAFGREFMISRHLRDHSTDLDAAQVLIKTMPRSLTGDVKRYLQRVREGQLW